MLSLSHHVFLEVAANLSFSKAAKALYISQPAISRHIHLLEGQYNCALFERKGNSIQLTMIGDTIYKYLQEAKEIQRKIEFEVSNLALLVICFGSSLVENFIALLSFVIR